MSPTSAAITPKVEIVKSPKGGRNENGRLAVAVTDKEGSPADGRMLDSKGHETLMRLDGNVLTTEE